MGPEGIKKPRKLQDLGLGAKVTGDLLGDDVKYTVDGSTVRVTGTVFDIVDPWKEYSSVNNTGHFVAIQMPSICKGRYITVKGLINGDRTVKITDDLLLVVRLENLEGDTMPIDMDGKHLMTVDFSEVVKPDCPIGKAAFNLEKTDYGSFGNNALYYGDQPVNITWTNNTTAKVTGKLLWVTKDMAAPYESIQDKESYHFAFALDDWFSGKDIKVVGNNEKTAADTDWVMYVDENNQQKGFDVSYNDTLLAHFDLTGTELEIPVGEKAWDATTTSYPRYGNKDLLTENLEVTWDGIKATAKGKLKFINGKVSDAPKLTEGGNYFPVTLIPWFQDRPHKVYIKGKDPGYDTILKDKIYKVDTNYADIVVQYKDTIVAEINLRGLTLKPGLGQDTIEQPKPGVDFGYVNTSALIKDDVKIDWTKGDTGTATGTIYKYKMPEDHFEGAEGHYFPITINGYEGKEIELVGIGGATVTAEDENNVVFQVDAPDGFSKPNKIIKVRVPGQTYSTIAEINVDGLTLSDETYAK